MTYPQGGSINDYADLWRYDVGVNVIPADTRKKETYVSWKEWQDKPIPEDKHKEWKTSGAYENGIAIILGKVHHNRQKSDLYLIGIDCDNAKAIEEMCSRNGQNIPMSQLAQWTLVEQHLDDPTKAHILLYSHKPFPKKSSDNKGPLNEKLNANEVPAIEVKGLGSHGILFVTPSVHKNGQPYQILGTHNPVIDNDFVLHIDTICRKYSIPYLEKAQNGNGKALLPIQDLFKQDFTIVEGHNRHEALLRAMESLIARNSGILSLDEIKPLAQQWNLRHCCPPLDIKDFEKQWKSAKDFIARNKTEEHEAFQFSSEEEDESGSPSKKSPIVKAITEDILSRYHFITIEESREILVYNNGVYVQGGEVLIEKTAEEMYGYKVANRHLAEIKGHIMRTTYHKNEELDCNINIINLKNGLYNIDTCEFKEHTPDYLSITQRPIAYNPIAKPKLFGKYLQQVLYATEIRTAIGLMAFTLYRDNPFEIIVKLFGYGANGKSVFTGLLTALHGPKNISNVPLSSMLKNRFALSDLENKYINIDTELSSTTIHDTTVLKKLTGRQPIRIERKNQRAYDTTLYAKLIFSANKIPETEDESDAYFRREIIISFPNRFEDGKGADHNLLNKLTTEDELSGIFNVLVVALRNIQRNGSIFVNARTIEQRRQRHELAVNPLKYFITDAWSKDSVESDKTLKDILYEAYKRFCNRHKLAIESNENFGRTLKNRFSFQDGRETSGERRMFWKGVKLTTKYDIPDLQQTFEDVF